MHRVGDSSESRMHWREEIRKLPSARRAPAIFKLMPRLALRPFLWPDYAASFYLPGLEAARRLLSQEPFDVLITVAHPFTSHRIGLALRNEFRGRWIADTGDPFSLTNPTPPNNQLLFAARNRAVEADVLHNCDAFALTAPCAQRAYLDAFPDSSGKLHVIPPLAPNSGPAIAPSEGFRRDPGAPVTLRFSGRLYLKLRDPRPLLALHSRIRRLNPEREWRLVFQAAVRDCGRVVKLDPEGGVFIEPLTERQEAFVAMQASDVLINIGNRSATQLPSKLADYAATGRPILNLMSHNGDCSAEFLARYPAALSIPARTSEEAAAQAESVIAFVDSAPDVIGASERVRFLEPYSLASVANSYQALFSCAS